MATTEDATKLMDERTDLAKDLYELARKEHAPDAPCDEDIECQECTLLLIASEELGLPEPWEGNERPSEGMFDAAMEALND